MRQDEDYRIIAMYFGIISIASLLIFLGMILERWFLV